MGWVNGVPLDQVSSQTWDGILSPQDVAQYLFEYLMRLIVRLAEHGLVHGDFNEFNLLLRQQFIEDPRPYIDRLLSGELKTLSLIEKKSWEGRK
jgi:RIO-like serine/threonine protein kinase